MNRRSFIACSLTALVAPFLPKVAKKKGARVLVNQFPPVTSSDTGKEVAWRFMRNCAHPLNDTECKWTLSKQRMICNRVNPDKCLGHLGARHLNVGPDYVAEAIRSGKADDAILRLISKRSRRFLSL